MPLQIREGNIQEVVELSKLLPEFHNPHGASEYKKRLSKTAHLILIALIDNKLAGFKVGYAKEGYFYSWMGGVLPAYRRLKIAKSLADQQEAWALSNGFDRIVFKTMNKHKKMLTFAVNNGFDIIECIPKDQIDNYRILLEKKLT